MIRSLPNSLIKKSSILITGVGAFEPEAVLTNQDLTKLVDTTDAWIVDRTGIRERRIANDKESTASMGVEAAKQALSDANLEATDIDLLIVVTMTPEQPCPATACFIQTALDLRPVPAFDIQATCSGFIYGLEVASKMMLSGQYKHCLLIGSEKMSSFINWEDRTTCVLFGDGAGAIVLSKKDNAKSGGVIDCVLGANGNHSDLLYIESGGSASPATADTVARKGHCLRMNGRGTYKNAVRSMEAIVKQLLDRTGLPVEEIDYCIPHQANLRIINAIGERLGLQDRQLIKTVSEHGNTSGASIPLALNKAYKENIFVPGDYLIFVSFGAGLTWAASLIQWGKE